MKIKRSRVIPLVLVIYLIGISIYSWPGRNPQITFLQYGITILITAVCILLLTILLKKRDEFRKKNSKKDN